MIWSQNGLSDLKSITYMKLDCELKERSFNREILEIRQQTRQHWLMATKEPQERKNEGVIFIPCPSMQLP